jgi:DNA-binding PadR family transcriptional regulator
MKFKKATTKEKGPSRKMRVKNYTLLEFRIMCILGSRKLTGKDILSRFKGATGSDDVSIGSFYPAMRRLFNAKDVKVGTSEEDRRFSVYVMTKSGKQKIDEDAGNLDRVLKELRA